MPKIQILAGAPRKENLAPRSDDCSAEWLPAFSRFLSGDSFLSPTLADSSLSSSSSWPEWRVVPVTTRDPKSGAGPFIAERSNESIRSNYIPSNHQVDQDAPLLAGGQPNENNTEKEEEFLEESFAIYNSTVLPSNDRPDDDERTNASFASHTTTDFSFMSTTSYDSTTAPALPARIALMSLPSGIEHLENLPKFDYLVGISPQTVTVNLVVGVISVAAPRTIQLRRYNSTMDIVEILVGDETRTGFSIKFWLAPQKPRADEDPTREALQSLRTRDVVLLRNVALHVWQNSVYGQSLSKRISRNETKVELLGRDGEVDLDATTTGLSPQMTKVKRVSDWVFAFLGTSEVSRGANKVEATIGGVQGRHLYFDDIELPPDTQ
jgi:hypothetical protein